MTSPLEPVIPYPGNKRRIAARVWGFLGNPPVYVEPFAGMLAVLLARPHTQPSCMEVVGDVDGLVANFHRAMAADPDGLLQVARYPLTDVDYTARIRSCLEAQGDLTEKLASDPDYYDTKLAGWWAYVQSTCMFQPWRNMPKRIILPDILCHKGMRSSSGEELRERVYAISRRLEHVAILCRDATEVLKAVNVYVKSKYPIGVFLDPPYQSDVRSRRMYRMDYDGVEGMAWKWAIEHGDDPRWRIVVAGHEDGREVPPGWKTYCWKRHGGWALASKYPKPETTAHKERLWVSPHCLVENIMDLFG